MARRLKVNKAEPKRLIIENLPAFKVPVIEFGDERETSMKGFYNLLDDDFYSGRCYAIKACPSEMKALSLEMNDMLIIDSKVEIEENDLVAGITDEEAYIVGRYIIENDKPCIQQEIVTLKGERSTKLHDIDGFREVGKVVKAYISMESDEFLAGPRILNEL